MFEKLMTADQVLELLDLRNMGELNEAISSGVLKPYDPSASTLMFAVGDVVVYALGRVIESIGVDAEKSHTYAEAVLSQRLRTHEDNLVEWVENETQDLYCLIADKQLARIFLRSKEDEKEIDVGAVKPILFPTVQCEINVFRIVRPVLVKVRRMTEPSGD